VHNLRSCLLPVIRASHLCLNSIPLHSLPLLTHGLAVGIVIPVNASQTVRLACDEYFTPPLGYWQFTCSFSSFLLDLHALKIYLSMLQFSVSISICSSLRTHLV
jgi:hypothetical protein